MLRIPSDFDPVGRGELAESYFKEGYNCCQSVLLAFADLISEDFGIDKNSLAALGSGFGGGFGRLREVCGAVSGMTLLSGFIHPAANPAVKSDRTANYALVQEFAEAYRRENGSIVCRELLGLENSDKGSPAPSERTPEYYKKRPCAKLVNMAAAIVAAEIAEQAAH